MLTHTVRAITAAVLLTLAAPASAGPVADSVWNATGISSRHEQVTVETTRVQDESNTAIKPEQPIWGWILSGLYQWFATGQFEL